MKKLFVTFLCIAMVAVFLPAMAFAATTTEVGADPVSYTHLAAACADAGRL